MADQNLSTVPLPRFHLWEKVRRKRSLVSFELEVTARCNNNCRHCYINLPANDRAAQGKELSLEETKEIVDDAVSLGAMWCLITGGEPLLRDDFPDLYMLLKTRGLLVSIFTNATLITPEHAQLFKRYPPRDIEVSVYGVTKGTYARVTRQDGSFEAFIRGLDLLETTGVKVRLKAMALRSNIREFDEIARFCRERTKDYFRFDPFLHLRHDGDQRRNEDIRSERLSPQEIAAIERSDPERFRNLESGCEEPLVSHPGQPRCTHLFRCGAGLNSFTLGHAGTFRLCSSLCHPDCVFDLRRGTLSEAWQAFIPKVRAIRSDRKGFLEGCKSCQLINLCMWCPGTGHLETGEMDGSVTYFCQVARARAEMLEEAEHQAPETRCHGA